MIVLDESEALSVLQVKNDKPLPELHMTKMSSIAAFKKIKGELSRIYFFKSNLCCSNNRK